jgi:aminopeptidase N
LRAVHRVALALTALGFRLASAAALADQPFDFAATPGKLPKIVIPTAYRIDLAPELDSLSFKGREEVDIAVSKATDVITLNANGLAFQAVGLKGEDGAKAAVSIDANAETATFHFPHALAAGPHTLHIEYSGPITAQPSGIYYNDYEAAGAKKRMLVTQFEATDARRMFPGWDEPAFKATFTLSAVLPSNFRAISNTPIAKGEPAGAGKTRFTFGTTPKMSSYLVVLVAGELDRIDQSAVGADIGVDAIQGKVEQGRYALGAASQILPYYNDYFGVKYPLPKLDLIAIPGNFAAGAMENWGGITYIDNDLLYDPATSTESTRQSVFGVIAHEMAHQWSGDLVTMAWWNDIWLNEGFASWMASKSTDHFNPDWKVWLRAHAETDRAMAEDSRRTTHPIQQVINDESEAESAFDDITYLKGQAFIRMIEAYLGEDAFRDGMRRYMAAHAYSNTTSADLWGALEAASGKPVARIAEGFTEKPGVPLVEVKTRCAGDHTEVTLNQDRFAIHDPAAKKLAWQIPVTIAQIGASTPSSLLLDPRGATIKEPGCGKPVKVNIGDVGYYRAHYDDADLKALISAYKQMDAADRVNLIGDVWAMVEAGRGDAASFLDLTRRLDGETELAVWTQILSDLRQIDDLERGSPERDAFRAYARRLLDPVLDRVGWDARPGEPPDEPILRSSLIRALGRFGDQAVIAEARKQFAAFLADPKSLPPGLQDAVAIVVGYAADRAFYDQLHALGKASTGTETRLRYYGALSGAHDPALIADTVAITRTDEITAGRINRFIAAAASASDDPDLVWKLFLPDRKLVLDKLTPGQASGLLPAIAEASSSPAVAAELKSLPEANASAGARHEVDLAVEEIDFKSDLKARLLPAVSTWLKATSIN